jgi:hypothetical protein
VTPPIGGRTLLLRHYDCLRGQSAVLVEASSLDLLELLGLSCAMLKHWRVRLGLLDQNVGACPHHVAPLGQGGGQVHCAASSTPRAYTLSGSR